MYRCALFSKTFLSSVQFKLDVLCIVKHTKGFFCSLINFEDGIFNKDDNETYKTAIKQSIFIRFAK